MKLILFTNRYPYLPGEEFIETEINYLVSRFSEIIVVPMLPGSRQRTVPSGVRVDNTLASFLDKGTPTLHKLRHLFGLPLVRFVVSHPKVFWNRKLLKIVISHWIRAKSIAEWMFRSKHLTGNSTQTVYYTYWLGQITTALAIYRSANSNLLFVSRCHGADLYGDRVYKGVFPFREFVMGSIHKVLPCSEDGRDYLQKRYRQWQQKISTARLGVRAFGTNPWNPKPGVIRVCSCSHVVEVKRLSIICRAIQILQQDQSVEKIVWTHFGDGPLLAQLQNEADTLQGNIQIDFRRSVPNAEVQSSYGSQAFDVFVNSSRSEGLPVSIMEALSFGIPVVAPNVGGVSELVNNDNGCLVNANCTALEVANGILHVTAGSERMRKAAQDTWRQLANADKNYGEFTTMLSDLAAATGAGYSSESHDGQ